MTSRCPFCFAPKQSSKIGNSQEAGHLPIGAIENEANVVIGKKAHSQNCGVLRGTNLRALRELGDNSMRTGLDSR